MGLGHQSSSGVQQVHLGILGIAKMTEKGGRLEEEEEVENTEGTLLGMVARWALMSKILFKNL